MKEKLHFSFRVVSVGLLKMKVLIFNKINLAYSRRVGLEDWDIQIT